MRALARFQQSALIYHYMLPCLILMTGSYLLPGCQVNGQEKNIQVWWSSELLPGSPVWYTNPPRSKEILYKLDRQADLHWQQDMNSNHFLVKVKPDSIYQSILGIGTSFEATTIYAIRKAKSNRQIRELLRSILDPDQGMGLNLFRICIGTSDFSDGRSVSVHPQGFYSYQDQPDAPFSIQPDIDLGIIDLLNLVQQEAASLDLPHEINFFASCWSPPPWMKTSGSLIGGSLKPGYEGNLARYFRQFIEAYLAKGIQIYAITLQNEPNYLPDDYPGMFLTPQQQLDLTIATWEEFHHNLNGKKELNTRIWINDHNFEDWANADFILSSLEKIGKKHYVDASAFHNYSDAPAAHMTELHQKHPQIKIVFTEHSEWGVAGLYNIQQYFWNWSRSYMYWVTMTTARLDEHNQSPYNQPGQLSPTLLIESRENPEKWYVTPEYYLISQFSKFIRPGARRISCDHGSPDSVTFVAFKNPDQSIIVVAVNQSEKKQAFTVQFAGKYFDASLPSRSVGTYRW